MTIYASYRPQVFAFSFYSGGPTSAGQVINELGEVNSQGINLLRINGGNLEFLDMGSTWQVFPPGVYVPAITTLPYVNGGYTPEELNHQFQIVGQ